jgi:hypothetical protein
MSTLEETRQFLQVLYASSPTSYLTLTAIHPDGKHASPSRHIPLSDTHALMKGLDDLQVANRQGWGAYFSVANRRSDLGRWRRGGLADLAQLPALFVDIDTPLELALKRLQGCDPPPSCVVASGLGIHAYWFLESPSHNWTLAQVALNRLRKEYQADKTSVVSCLRLPNTHNTKPQRQNALCQIVRLNQQRYPLEIFLPNPREKTAQTAQTGQTSQTAHFSKLAATQISQETDWSHPLRTSQSRQTAHLNPRLVQAVCSCLVQHYAGQWKRNGWLAARCPCQHERDSVGMHFSFNPDKALGVCLGKHGQMLLKDLCQHLSIRPLDYGGLY